MDFLLLKEELRQRASEVGFTAVGVTRADLPSGYGHRQKAWLDAGHHGEMEYMKRTADMRAHGADAVLEGAQSVLVFAAPYFQHEPAAADTSETGKIARYALGQDYHYLLREKLEPVQQWLAEQLPGERWRTVVDSAPLNERAYAVESGVGFYGRNTMVIVPRAGSYFLLAEIVTTARIPPDDPIAGSCGTCTRCLDACPTGAILRPHQVDARKCISYLTIEKKSPLTEAEHAASGEWLFGCDICQDVCPYNKSPEPALLAELAGTLHHVQPLQELLSLESNSQFERRVGSSPLLRAGKRRLHERAKKIRDLLRKSRNPCDSN